MVWHGPHHVAKKSIKTGVSVEMISLKLAIFLFSKLKHL
ncbi:hypothetical protein JCM19297_3037 [Nonlabens ulvanivorans]|nr:hypothetical protein JCM19297_3037 [Nonlabens ulvanivorans]